MNVTLAPAARLGTVNVQVRRSTVILRIDVEPAAAFPPFLMMIVFFVNEATYRSGSGGGRRRRRRNDRPGVGRRLADVAGCIAAADCKGVRADSERLEGGRGGAGGVTGRVE